MEISFQQLIIIIGLTSGLVWYFSKCGTQRMIKFRINWWFEHRFVRWCEHTEIRFENWNKKMTKLRWFFFTILILSGVFIPIIIWSAMLPDEEKTFFGDYGTIIFLIEYLGLIIINGIGLYRKKLQHSNVNVEKLN